jgi:hypothetical protein
MTLRDYAVAIGNRVCDIATQINAINTKLVSQQTQIDWIITNYAPTTPVTLPTFGSTCLTDKIPTVPPGGVSLVNMVNAIQEAFCELRGATGMPSDLLTGIAQECVNLDTSTSLSYPGTNMGSLPGWKVASSYSTVADSINNMWITICDMRTAIRSIQSLLLRISNRVSRLCKWFKLRIFCYNY